MPTVLDQSFAVYGLFHDWDGQDFRKRAVLEILRSATPPSDRLPDDFLDQRPDLCVVMMNPGSSVPLPGFGQAADEGTLIPAKPDRVQYQIMRLLVLLDLRHARVVNLSDIRAAKSADLYERIEQGASAADLGCLFAGHSAVTAPRVVTARRVICGWGLDPRLAQMANQAHRWLNERGVELHGVRAPADFPAYRYPKPVGNWSAAVQWLDAVHAALRVSLARHG